MAGPPAARGSAAASPSGVRVLLRKLMFIERLLNQGNAPILEQVVRFAAARHELLAANIANIDTVDYRQKDLSLRRFQRQLISRVEDRRRYGARGVRFDDIALKPEQPVRGILSHDGNNRSMEQLASDVAKNALMHNLAIELLRKQYMGMEMALKERIA
jgi:flagellar basal-body rod protein FlgB